MALAPHRVCVHVPGATVEHEIAEVVSDHSFPVNLNRLQHVSVMADDEVRTEIDISPAIGHQLGCRILAVLEADMQTENQKVDQGA